MFASKLLKITTLLTLTVFAMTSYAGAPEGPRTEERSRFKVTLVPGAKPLQGKIINGRYHAPDNVFSCQAYDFGMEICTVEDGERYARESNPTIRINHVTFYDNAGNSKRVDVIYTPGSETKTLNEQEFYKIIGEYCINPLLEFNKAQGLEVLREEMIEPGVFFKAISVEKIPGLNTPQGESIALFRGHLAFQEKNKLVLVVYQKATIASKKHNPEKQIEKLKQSLLEFKSTLELNVAAPVKQTKAESTCSPKS